MAHVIPRGSLVGGVTSLGDDVFIVHYNSQQIEVYDAKTVTLQRHITVPGLGRISHGLVACPHNKCLYASDYHNDSVHRVEVSSSKVMKLSVARGPAGLSMNSEHKIMFQGTLSPVQCLSVT